MKMTLDDELQSLNQYNDHGVSFKYIKDIDFSNSDKFNMDYVVVDFTRQNPNSASYYDSLAPFWKE